MINIKAWIQKTLGWKTDADLRQEIVTHIKNNPCMEIANLYSIMKNISFTRLYNTVIAMGDDGLLILTANSTKNDIYIFLSLPDKPTDIQS